MAKLSNSSGLTITDISLDRQIEIIQNTWFPIYFELKGIKTSGSAAMKAYKLTAAKEGLNFSQVKKMCHNLGLKHGKKNTNGSKNNNGYKPPGARMKAVVDPALVYIEWEKTENKNLIKEAVDILVRYKKAGNRFSVGVSDRFSRNHKKKKMAISRPVAKSSNNAKSSNGVKSCSNQEYDFIIECLRLANRLSTINPTLSRQLKDEAAKNA